MIVLKQKGIILCVSIFVFLLLVLHKLRQPIESEFHLDAHSGSLPQSSLHRKLKPGARIDDAFQNSVDSLEGLLELHDEDRIPVMIVVISAMDQSEKRKAIRLTWGNRTLLRSKVSKNTIGPLFFVGTQQLENSASTLKYQALIEAEQEKFGDLIQVPVAEEYRRLPEKMLAVFGTLLKTYGSLSELELWRNLHILKTDDDAYVRLPALVSLYRESMSILPVEKCFYCVVYENVTAIRNRTNKYYVGSDEYQPTKYPTYCGGVAYMFPFRWLEAIVEKASHLQMIPMEDVFYTGIVGEALGFSHTRIPKGNPAVNMSIPCLRGYYYVRHPLSFEDMVQYHRCMPW